MTIIESVKQYIAACPLLGEFRRVHVDFLPPDTGHLSIEEVPTSTVLKRCIDGSSERQFVFVLAGRLRYSDEVRTQIDNSGLYERFADWLEEQSENDHLPIMGDGKQAYKIEAMSSGYLFDVMGDLASARYQIQCRLLYDQE